MSNQKLWNLSLVAGFFVYKRKFTIGEELDFL
jgi:hypothetical protein